MANQAEGRLGKELLNLPFAEMVQKIATGIAQAQFELDQMSLRLTQMMTGRPFTAEVPDPDNPGGLIEEEQEAVLVKFGPGPNNEYSLLELGFTPTFYQFVDTIIEVKMSISMSSESSSRSSWSQTKMSAKAGGAFFGIGGAASASAKVTSVSASYASKYQYSAEGSSLIRTKLVPVPPPAILEERIRRIMDSGVS